MDSVLIYRRPEHDYKTEDNYIGDPQRKLLMEREF